MTETGQPARNMEIQALRGLAILLTLGNHMDFEFFSSSRWIRDLKLNLNFGAGVDLFFAISGFVITQSLLRLCSQEKDVWLAIRLFWKKRAIRILPPAWFWLAVYVFCALFLNQTGAFGPPQGTIYGATAAFFLVANYFRYQVIQNHVMDMYGPPVVYWSLSLEEQFYIFLPTLLAIAKRFFDLAVLVIIGAQFFLPRPEWSFWWAFRTDAFFWGVLIARAEGFGNLSLRISSFDSKVRSWGLVVLLTCLVLILYLPNWHSSLRFDVGLLAATCALLVFLASKAKDLLLPPSLARGLLIWLGDRSYSIYLSHIFVLQILAYFSSLAGLPAPGANLNQDVWQFVLSFLGICMIGNLSYRLLEVPLRKFSLRTFGN